MTGGRVVAVTGATGFLGGHLVAALAHQGARLRLLARSDPGRSAWGSVPVEIVRGSLEDAAALARLVEGADAVVHAAGLVRARDLAGFLRVNRDGSLALAEAARRLAPEARFVEVSSLAAREPRLSHYAASKRAGEAAAQAAYADAADRLVILRPPAIYGEGDRATLPLFKSSSRIVAPVFGAGHVALVHAADAAAALARVALGAGGPGLYALSDPRPDGYSVREIMIEAARAQGRRPRLVVVPDRVLLAAGAATGWCGRQSGGAPFFTLGKAREMLHPDWSVAPAERLPDAVHRPAIGLTEGFRRTVAWYRSAGWL